MQSSFDISKAEISFPDNFVIFSAIVRSFFLPMFQHVMDKKKIVLLYFRGL